MPTKSLGSNAWVGFTAASVGDLELCRLAVELVRLDLIDHFRLGSDVTRFAFKARMSA